MTEEPPKPGTLVFAVGEVANASGEPVTSAATMATGKELRLTSVAGAPDMVYSWPLTVGKGESGVVAMAIS